MYRNMLLLPVYKEKLVALIIDEAHSHCNNLINFLFRGDKFHLSYAPLGDIRSLLPSDVNIMALTATSTHATFMTVYQRLSMNNPVVAHQIDLILCMQLNLLLLFKTFVHKLLLK